MRGKSAVFAIAFVIASGILIVVGMLDAYLHPWIKETDFTLLHFFSKHCLGIAWSSGKIWPHLFIAAVIAGATAKTYSK